MLHQRTFPSPKGEGVTDPLTGTLKYSAILARPSDIASDLGHEIRNICPLDTPTAVYSHRPSDISCRCHIKKFTSPWCISAQDIGRFRPTFAPTIYLTITSYICFDPSLSRTSRGIRPAIAVNPAGSCSIVKEVEPAAK